MHQPERQTLSDYTDKLYFGLLSMNPNPLIIEFLSAHVPIMLKKVDTSDKWTAYPPGTIKEPAFYKATHSYLFNSHPYFDGKFDSGHVAITIKRYQNNQWVDNITDLKLWFECYEEDEAKEAFHTLIEIFSAFDVLKRRTKSNNIEKFEATDKISNEWYSNISIILATDHSISKRLMIATETGSEFIYKPCYKIRVEAGNDL